MSGRPRKAGLLGPHVEGYRSWLAQRGYTPGTIQNMLADMAQVGRWLAAEGLEARQVSEELMAAFLFARREAGQRRVPGIRAMAPLLSYLREADVAAATEPSLTPLGSLLGRYRSWLLGERGLAATTVRRYENTARRFLQEQVSADDVFTPAALTGVDITRSCCGSAAASRRGRPRGGWLNCARS
jgi:hypothetical protein